jgi:hypothetical protein
MENEREGYDPSAMDAAAAKAQAEFTAELDGSSDDFTAGALFVCSLIKRYYMTAGYKRLCRFLKTLAS